MYRHRLVALIFIGSLFVWGCPPREKQEIPAPTVTTHTVGGQEMKPKRIFVNTALMTRFFFPCYPTDAAALKAATTPGVGGFGCSNNEPFPEVTFSVKVGSPVITPTVVRSDYLIDSTGKRITVEKGRCMTFRVLTDNPAFPATINTIDFIDTKFEANASGKQINSQVICDQCKGLKECVMYVGLPHEPDLKNIYRYTVKINHEGGIKKLDPEVEVKCGGCDERTSH